MLLIFTFAFTLALALTLVLTIANTPLLSPALWIHSVCILGICRNVRTLNALLFAMVLTHPLMLPLVSPRLQPADTHPSRLFRR